MQKSRYLIREEEERRGRVVSAQTVCFLRSLSRAIRSTRVRTVHHSPQRDRDVDWSEAALDAKGVSHVKNPQLAAAPEDGGETPRIKAMQRAREIERRESLARRKCVAILRTNWTSKICPFRRRCEATTLTEVRKMMRRRARRVRVRHPGEGFEATP